MPQVTRIAHAALGSPDCEAMVAHYTEVLGFRLTHRDQDGSAYLACGANQHDLVIHPAGGPAVRHVAFEISGTLEEADAELREGGFEVAMKSDAGPTGGDLLHVADPEGNAIELRPAVEAGAGGGSAPVGIRPLKLGHVALVVESPKAVGEFYERALGFRWSDWLADFFVFLRCGPDHHTMNFLAGSRPNTMHHIAFELRDWAHVQTACDELRRQGVGLQWGPGRHGPGHNVFTYHLDPDGNRVELFTQLDLMLDENRGHFEPRPWHEDRPQRPKVWDFTPVAANAWGQGPPDGFM